ncbi:MAG: hypothetical protein PUC47_11635 [Oscillospiraceae bacterium]|nr:hypothetical protein [Oscillospiraceae bacterium]
MKIKESLGERIFTVCNTLFMIILMVLMIYPLYYVLMAISRTTPAASSPAWAIRNALSATPSTPMWICSGSIPPTVPAPLSS